MTRWFGALGALLAAAAVAAGAFGAHGLRDAVTPERLDVWRTAASYHLLHAIALVVVAGLARAGVGHARALTVAGGAFLVGVLIFAGTLYVLVLTDTGWLGAITPIGGTACIVGWLALAWALWPSRTGPG